MSGVNFQLNVEVDDRQVVESLRRLIAIKLSNQRWSHDFRDCESIIKFYCSTKNTKNTKF